MKTTGKLLGMLGAGGACFALFGAAGAQPVRWNGAGPDPDGDSNPATNTRLLVKIGDGAEAALDPPFKIITFEAPPGGHGDVIRKQYEKKYGVAFSRGLKRQICEGQRYFQYNSECTYLRAPSGRFAAVYRDDWGRPLRIRFSRPVCAAALALYPTGGKEGEAYKVTLRPYADDETELPKVDFEFTWTNDTFRWRMMAGAYFLDRKAARLDVNIESKKDKKKIVRFLIDDVAAIEDDPATPADECALWLADKGGATPLAAEEPPAEEVAEVSGS